MKNKFLGVLLTFFVLTASVLAEDLRFVQVDGLCYSSEQALDKIITEVNRLKNVSFVVFSGNNISKPNRSDLEAFLKQAKGFKAPVYIILGQKDVNKQKNLGKADYMKIVSKHNHTHKKITSPNYVFEKKGVVFIVLDGSKEVIPTSMGYYKPEVVKWLDEQLTLNKDKNVVILQHYPIIPPCEKEMKYTAKPENYLKVLAKHNNVKAVVAGHFGVNKEMDYNGVKHISTADAPVYRVIDILDCETKKPEFWSIIKE